MVQAVSVISWLLLLLIIVGAIFIFKIIKQQREVSVRKRYFLENHGLLLHLISCADDATATTKIFTLKELIKATNNFDDSRIAGCGVHGNVYKGILSDLRVVAVKQSKVVDKGGIKELVNDVALLSQMNHRNLVKVLGCCLECEVPLLVYEFIPNATVLGDHIHGRHHKCHISWEERLRIASEVAGAVACLHFSTSRSIFHRDLQPSNILLDDMLTAKVSDFGASKFIRSDETHVSIILVGGVWVAYVDPEYYHTGRPTDKSDVYSFGVILVELLTGEKPTSICRSRELRNRITHFIRALNENKLLGVIEPLPVNEDTRKEIEVVSELAEACLKLKGEDRPTMKDVHLILDGLTKKIKKKQAADD